MNKKSIRFREDILSITAVHPMREDAVLELLQRTNSRVSSLNSLPEENLLEKLEYNGYSYYLRKFRK
jgi:hypothetical protein